MQQVSREWSYWTKNKLEILSGYLPAFNNAAKRSKHRIYIDLMAGASSNRERLTGLELDGSPTRALKSSPGFTKHVFCEMPAKADSLRQSLTEQFPTLDFRVVGGDCNESIDEILAKLRHLNWAPTFAFIDQQAAEVHWETMAKLSRFKKPTAKSKAELWILVSPAMVAKGVRGTNSGPFRERVTRFYGTADWLRIQDAREASRITAKQYRQEMVNLLRYRLATELGYKHTHRIPMQMPNKTEIYDMVFATDHPVGDKVMKHLYNSAAQREPGMMEQAVLLAKNKKIADSGQDGLFSLELPAVEVSGETLWRPEPHWDPKDRAWW